MPQARRSLGTSQGYVNTDTEGRIGEQREAFLHCLLPPTRASVDSELATGQKSLASRNTLSAHLLTCALSPLCLTTAQAAQHCLPVPQHGSLRRDPVPARPPHAFSADADATEGG